MDLKDAQFERKPAGVIIIGGEEVAHTRMCCHCGTHFVSVKGSGKVRGWCTLCTAITCGDPKCDPCVPYELRIEVMEGKSVRYKGQVFKPA